MMDRIPETIDEVTYNKLCEINNRHISREEKEEIMARLFVDSMVGAYESIETRET